MKSVNVKFIEISTNGTVNLSYKELKSLKQVIFYEKDSKNSSLSKKLTKKQSFHNFPKNYYKSKYKF